MIVLHDLDHALAHADQVAVLHNVRIRVLDSPTNALSEEAIGDVFGIRSAITPHPITGRPHLTQCAAVSGRAGIATPSGGSPIPPEGQARSGHGTVGRQ